MLSKAVRTGEEKSFGNFSRMSKKDVIILYLLVLLQVQLVLLITILPRQFKTVKPFKNAKPKGTSFSIFCSIFPLLTDKLGNIRE